MKKIIFLIAFAMPVIGYAQAIHLPNAPLLATGSGHNLLIDSGINHAFHSNAVTTRTTAPTINKYDAVVLTTNFTIPLVRVNFLVNKPTNATNSNVSTSYFNSVGAGLNYSWGEIDQTADNTQNSTSTDYYNHFGLQIGFLFAANSSAGSTTATTASTTTTTNQSGTIFAIVAGFSILNFQIGAGYEMGSLTAGQRRGFATLSYAIPMSTLIPGGYKIIKSSAHPSN